MKQTVDSFLACVRPRPSKLEIERFKEALVDLKIVHRTMSQVAVYDQADLGELFQSIRHDRAKLKQWLAANHPDKHGGKVHPLAKQAAKQFTKLKKRDAKARADYKVNHGLA